MKESCCEGLANHICPESAIVVGNSRREALTGEEHRVHAADP